MRFPTRFLATLKLVWIDSDHIMFEVERPWTRPKRFTAHLYAEEWEIAGVKHCPLWVDRWLWQEYDERVRFPSLRKDLSGYSRR